MMKKLFSFILGFVATTFMASAQITSDMFIQPANTGANMTVGVNDSNLDQFEGGQIGAFYDLNGDGTLQCIGLETITPGFFGLALWGDDSSTNDKDGLASGDSPEFAILHNGNVILYSETPQFTGYVTNGIANMTGACLFSSQAFQCTDPNACNPSPFLQYDLCGYSDDIQYCDYSCYGCTDPYACNYDPNAEFDDGSCEYISCWQCCDPNSPSFDCPYYDNFIEYVGDDLPIWGCDYFGCTDPDACNYDFQATIEDGSCTYPGCKDPYACNYNPDAGCGDESCNIPVGCDTCDGDGNVLDNDCDGDGVCDEYEIVGCMNPSAPNYNPFATDSQYDCDGDIYICDVTTIPFSTPGYPAHVVTSNNMSVLFPVNNSGLWNTDDSNLQEGDLVAAFYTTATLENDFLGYSATSAIANGGGVEWTGDQVGAAIFGADNGIDNGFEPGEELMWLVMRDGVVYNASATYATPGYDGTYEENIYVSANSLIVGEPFLNGCTSSIYMEYNPMASEDDGSCATYISVGCLDANFVNYAGADVDADNIHDNSENFGDPFGQNYTVDLNSGSTFPSGVGAIFHDVDLCQSQVPGCTYPYASNYDSQSTEDDGSCDWSAYSYHSFDFVTGENTGTLYSFGGDDDDSNNEWVGSDFEYANDLYQDARMGTGHVVIDLIASYDAYTERRKADSTFLSDTLIDVAAWFAADEAADAQELQDSLSDNYARFDAMFNHLSDSIQATLDSAALAFATDEAADAQELADSLDDNYARFDVMFNHLSDSISLLLIQL